MSFLSLWLTEVGKCSVICGKWFDKILIFISCVSS